MMAKPAACNHPAAWFAAAFLLLAGCDGGEEDGSLPQAFVPSHSIANLHPSLPFPTFQLDLELEDVRFHPSEPEWEVGIALDSLLAGWLPG